METIVWWCRDCLQIYATYTGCDTFSTPVHVCDCDTRVGRYRYGDITSNFCSIKPKPLFYLSRTSSDLDGIFIPLLERAQYDRTI